MRVFKLTLLNANNIAYRVQTQLSILDLEHCLFLAQMKNMHEEKEGSFTYSTFSFIAGLVDWATGYFDRYVLAVFFALQLRSILSKCLKTATWSVRACLVTIPENQLENESGSKKCLSIWKIYVHLL